MSIETLTGDEFVELSIEEHEEAMALYAETIQNHSAKLKAVEVGTIAHEDCLDQLGRLHTLRRVHQVRLAEMQEDLAELPASEQYRQNELSSVPS